jgi:SAM-dependent methyltransferase
MVDAASFWDSEVVVRNHTEWMAHPLVREHMNELVGGIEHPRWPFDMFQDWLGGRTFRRGLSIGCGAGALERDIIRRDLCRHVDAFDGSVVSLSLAAEQARKEGIGDRISYFAADFNRPALPRNKYDIVFFHQSAHHVSELEILYAEILRALKPSGLLYLDEFVGPSRDWWHDALLEPQRAVYRQIPAEHRLYEELPYPIQMDDPSEAVRSAEIEAYLGVGFQTILRRGYGGSLLSVVLPAVRPEAVDDAMVQWLIDEERKLLAAGAPSYYAIIVAKPKSFLRRLKAPFTYRRLLKERRAKRLVPSPEC